MDLKFPYNIPTKFDNNNFGINRQERRLSSLDEMFGQIFNAIYSKNGIIIFSSDHGDYIPPSGKQLDEIPKTQKILRKWKKSAPALEPAGLKVFKFLKNSNKKINYFKNKNKFSEIEKRGFLDRNEKYLFDDTINVPLIFHGKNFPTMQSFKLVRHVDIFPTICKILDLKFDEKNIDGLNIIEKIKKNESDELIAYIETGPANENLKGKIIGIRTAKYKYFRSRDQPDQDVNLYNLEKDQNEEDNINEKSPQLVIKMEKKLTDLITNHKTELKNSINKKISKLKLR
tara:strand:- start:3394 stop:4251 length:858 start_codon:yes stop_codon:yes gene_type:complete